jgi:chloramphenicol-sensitive protein RarD
MREPAVRTRLIASALLIGGNWFVFVYAVITDRLLDASLGYFINPLLSVALGRFVLREHLRRGQLIAVGLAAIGIAFASVRAGGIPWIALVVAGTFGGYGLVRKTVDVRPLAGSTFESWVLVPAAGLYLIWLHGHGGGTLLHEGWRMDLLLVGTGVVSFLPLWAFVNAAPRVTLTTLGFLQYIAPTMQFVLAVTVVGEPLAPVRLTAFVCVWVALSVFVTDAVIHARRASR